MRRISVVAVAAFMVAGDGVSPGIGHRMVAPNGVVAKAVEAVGGEAALRNLRTLEIETVSANFSVGQEDLPFSPPSLTVFTTKMSQDLAGRRYRLEGQLRAPGVPAGTVQLNQRASEQAAMQVTPGGQIPAPRALHENIMRRLDGFMPVQLLRLVDHPEAVSSLPARQIGSTLAPGVRFAYGPDTLALYFDPGSGLPLQQESVGDDPIRGDATTTITWSRWIEGAVWMPGQINTEVNGKETSVVTQRITSMNRALEDSTFTIPDSIIERFRQLPPVTAAAAVAVTEVAPHVWRMSRTNYHSLVVEQSDRLVMIEAPLSADFTRAVLDTLSARFPGKRVGYVVNTHHHWDHSGGIRAVLAAGIPVATHVRNVDFIRQVGTAPKTVRPDALSRRGRLPEIKGVSDTLTLGRGPGRVQLFTMPSVHGRSILVAFVPESGVLFQSDVLTASARGSIAKPAAREVVNFIKARGLNVTRVVGGHGEVAPIEAIQQAAQ